MILLNAFFAASEIAILSVRKPRIRQLAEEQGSASALAVLRLTDNPSRLLATIQIGITLAGFFASAIGAISAVALLDDVLKQVPLALVAQASQPIAFVIVTVAISFLTLIVGELVPKSLAIQYAEVISLLVARPIEGLAIIAAPAIALLTLSTNSVLRLLGSRQQVRFPSITEEEIRSMIDVGEEEGVVEPAEREMLQGVFDLAQKRVHEVMVPRVDMVAVERDASVEDALRLFLAHGYSRLPVYDGSLDNIVGILYAKDLLRHFVSQGQVADLSRLWRPPVFVPESKLVSQLLLELRQSRNHMVIVIDEYGGTAGLVTLEDLLEEIVGEIDEEYDEAEAKEIQVVGDSIVEVSGRYRLGDLNDALSLALEAGGMDSVGGLVYSQLGRMPVAGDQVSLPEATITVLAVSGRRIERVRVARRPPPVSEAESELDTSNKEGETP